MMAEAAAALKLMEDELNCLVCLEIYTDPKQLQCHHVFCQQCLVRLVVRDQQGEEVITCPSCRQVTPVPASGVAGFQSAFQTSKLLDILKEHKRAKEDQKKAKVEHEKTEMEHKKAEEEQEKAIDSVLYCADHEDRELELFCETCEKLVCLQCTIKEHRGHEYNLVKEVLEKHKQEIKAALAPAEKQLTAVCKALEGVNTRMKDILDQQATLEAKIHNESQQLVNAIKTRTNELLHKLQLITEQKLRDLGTQSERIETTKTQLSSYLDKVGETLASGGQGEVMKVKTTVTKKVMDLTAAALKTKPLEPITQADIEFLASSKALKVCQSYGKVVALGSPDPSRCLTTGKSQVVVAVGDRASVIFQAFNFMGLPYEESLKSLECELVSEVSGDRETCSIERRGQSQYEISFQPTVKGRHQLHVKVEGQHIKRTPLVTFKSPVEKLGTPILTIDGVERPWGVAINQRGEVVTTECGRHCISVFSPSGKKLRSFGTFGISQSQFNYPRGVAVDGEGNILVVDVNNHRIQKFTADGEFLTAVGTEGSGPLQFLYPVGIAVNSSNNKVYVGDGKNHRVQVLNSDLTFSSTFGKKGSGSGKGHLDWVHGVACDSTGNVYVADFCNNRIQVFTAEGKFLRTLGRCDTSRSSSELNGPVGVAIDTSDMVYVGDSDNHRVCVFTPEGQCVTAFGKKGVGPGHFKFPQSIAVDNCGVVYVCDLANNCIQLF